MFMTREGLIAAVKKFVPEQMVSAINLPTVLAFVAADLWVKKTPDDFDTAMIRQALLDLHSKGHFCFENPRRDRDQVVEDPEEDVDPDFNTIQDKIEANLKSWGR